MIAPDSRAVKNNSFKILLNVSETERERETDRQRQTETDRQRALLNKTRPIMKVTCRREIKCHTEANHPCPTSVDGMLWSNSSRSLHPAAVSSLQDNINSGLLHCIVTHDMQT